MYRKIKGLLDFIKTPGLDMGGIVSAMLFFVLSAMMTILYFFSIR